MDYPFYVTWSKQKDLELIDIKSVSGAIITTKDGKDIFDMSSISYQAHFGHNHPIIIKNIIEQLNTVPMSSPKANFPNKIETTLKLLNYMKKEDGKIFYTTSGAESVENALKIARDITKKKIILARQNSYHGATLGALTVTGDWRNPAHQTPQDWVLRIPEPDFPKALELTREIILKNNPDKIAAIIIETITGGNGVYFGSDDWWKGIRSICNEFNILLILDEVVCGFERTGKPFGYMHHSLDPDIVCLAKGISGGMIPFGAVWTSKKISEYYSKNILCCGLTNYAHPLGIAALKGVLEIVNNLDFKENLNQLELIFREELSKFKSHRSVLEVRSIGLLAAIDLDKTIDAKYFIKNGIYLISQNNRIILAPPLILNVEQLKLAMNKIFKTIEDNS